MVTENVDVVVRQRGARTVKRNFDAIAGSVDRAARSVSFFNRALLVLGGAGAVTALARYADQLTNIENRLKLTTTGTKNLEEVQSRLFDVANRSRSGFAEVADIYSRIALSTRELGISQEETARLTESLSKATILSGASAREASAGLVQLGQGLASNRLSGDELRSVLEQLPFVADVIAKHLKITRGELREFGRDGKVTGEVVVKAFQEMETTIDALFAQTIPTIGQGLTVLNNEFARLIDALDDATGSSSLIAGIFLGLADTMGYLADNADTVINVIETLIYVIGTGLAVIAIPAAISAFTALAGLIFANPFVALATTIVVAISAMIAFNEEMFEAGGAIRELLLTMEALGSVAKSVMSGIVAAINAVIPSTRAFAVTWDGVASAINGAILFVIDSIDFMRAAFIAAVDGIIAAWNALPGAFQRIAATALNGAIGIVEAGVNKIISLISSIPFVGEQIGASPISIQRLDVPAGNVAAETVDATQDSFARNRGVLTERFEALRQNALAVQLLAQEERIYQEAVGGSTEATAASLPALEAASAGADKAGGSAGGAADKVDQLRKSFEQLEASVSPLAAAEQKLTETQKTLDAAVAAGITTAERAEEIYRRVFREVVGVGNAETDLAEKQQLLNRALEEGVISASEYRKAMAELNDSTNFFKDALETTFNAASSALADFVRTGKFDFAEFTRSLLADLTQLAANQLFQQLLSGGLGGLGGGGGGGGGLGGIFSNLLGGLGNLLPFAHGGQFEIGGRGGVDKNLLSINNKPFAKVSKGEKVTITPNNSNSSGQMSVVMNFHITTPDGNIPRQTQEQIAARAATALRRADRRNN